MNTKNIFESVSIACFVILFEVLMIGQFIGLAMVGAWYCRGEATFEHVCGMIGAAGFITLATCGALTLLRRSGAIG